jgi:hypothetical protein
MPIAKCRFILGFTALALSNYALAAIPPQVLPGAFEVDVRAALPLLNCKASPADPRSVNCETGATELDGTPGTYKVTFAFGRLMFMSFFFEKKDFDAATTTVTKLLGAPNRTESYAIPAGVNRKDVLQKIFVWGNAELLASVSLYAPGKDPLAQIFFLFPEAVPREVRDTYLPLIRGGPVVKDLEPNAQPR